MPAAHRASGGDVPRRPWRARDAELARHHFRKTVALLLGEGTFKESFRYAEARLPAGFDVWTEIREAYQWRDLVRDGWDGPRQYPPVRGLPDRPQRAAGHGHGLQGPGLRGAPRLRRGQYRMYEAVRDGEVAETVERQRLFLLEDAARNGVAEAQLELGLAYYSGAGAPRTRKRPMAG